MIMTLLFAGVTVTLPMKANVSGTNVTVNEVARITGEDLAEVALVGAVDLGYSPMPGHSRLFFGKRVAEIIFRETGIEVTLNGDRACRAWPEVETVPGPSIEAAAHVELKRLSTDRDIEYVLIDRAQSVAIPAGLETAKLEAYFDKPLITSGPVSVPVRLIVDGEIYRTIWTRWSVAVYELRTVLIKPAAAGQLLTPSHFTQKRVLVPKFGANNPLGRALAIGAVAARDLKVGDMVTTLDVKRPIVIKRGDTIYLQVRSRGISARVPATAEEDAALGDRIRVTTVTGEREMSATVLSRDLVEVVINVGQN